MLNGIKRTVKTCIDHWNENRVQNDLERTEFSICAELCWIMIKKKRGLATTGSYATPFSTITAIYDR